MTGLLWLLVAALAGLSCLFAACTAALRTFNHIRLEEELAYRGRAKLLQPAWPDRLGRLILSAQPRSASCSTS